MGKESQRFMVSISSDFGEGLVAVVRINRTVAIIRDKKCIR